MKEKVIFVTSDELEFDSREDAEAHEKGISSINEINEFLEHREVRGKKLTEYRKLLMAWEAFNAQETGQDLPERKENE